MTEAAVALDEDLRRDFIRDIVRTDLIEGRVNQIITRFPPEPNGYLHLGHAKSICLNFGIAEEFSGKCHLRFDDTNPTKEEQEYIDAIIKDVRWLGFDWGENLHFTSDYFEQLYGWAIHLIKTGQAYVDDLSADEIREHRGTLKESGRNSPYRDRTIDENLDLFEQMRAKKFKNGERVLRAKIDMASGNINMRDPVLYRILHANHPRTGDDWCIYPTYDFAHGQSDAIESVSHSLCTLEFENHRPLYDWLVERLPTNARPHQYEFAKLSIGYSGISLGKRRLRQLVEDNIVKGWDDPRMPTLSALRRRGTPPEAVREFARKVGISKAENLVEPALLEHCIRDHLNHRAQRRMAILRPLKITIENYPDDQVEEMTVPNSQEPGDGTRNIPFSKEIYIEQTDFMEDPPKKFFRLGPGREVRLRSAYFLTCTDVIKNGAGEVAELRCTYDPETRGGASPDGRKVKGTLHWVSARHSISAEVRLYEPLFSQPIPGRNGDFLEDINKDSLEVLENCMLEPSLADVKTGQAVQFERQGYFAMDPDSTPNKLVFNRTISLRDSWGKTAKT